MTNLFAKHIESNWTAFDTYKVKIRCRDLVGGKPATAEMIQKWVEATNKAKTREERQKIADAHLETMKETVDGVAEKQSVVFARVDGQLCIEGRQVKAMLKEAANIIKDIVPTGRKEKLSKADKDAGKEPKPEVGIKALKSKVADQVFVEEEYIPLGRTEPDRIMERAIHVMTAQGPRTSIKRSEVCEGVELSFTVKRRAGAGLGVPEITLLAILDYAQTNGLGADRSQGFGTFEVLSVEKL